MASDASFVLFSENYSENPVKSYTSLTGNVARFKIVGLNRSFWNIISWMNGGLSDFPAGDFSPTTDQIKTFIAVNSDYYENPVKSYTSLTGNVARFKIVGLNRNFWNIISWMNGGLSNFPGWSMPSNAFVAVNRTSNQLQITLPPQDSIGNFRYGKKDSSKGFITAMTIFFDGPLSLTGTLPTIASHNVTHDSANNALDIYSESNIVLEEGQIYNVLATSNVTGTLPQISRIEFGMGIYVDGDDTEYEDELLYTSSSADATAYSIPQYKYHDASLINIYSDGVLV